MVKLVFVIFGTVVMVVFAMANTHHAELSFVVGKPAEVRVIFLLGSAYLAGVVSTVLWTMARNIQRTRELRTRQLRAAPKSDDLDEFED
jgi:uncharacterized integral membrane protein